MQRSDHSGSNSHSPMILLKIHKARGVRVARDGSPSQHAQRVLLQAPSSFVVRCRLLGVSGLLAPAGLILCWSGSLVCWSDIHAALLLPAIMISLVATGMSSWQEMSLWLWHA